MKDLPESWSRVEITKVLEANNNGKPFQQGWSPRCESFPAPEGKWGVLKTTSIQHGDFWDHENKLLPDHLEPRTHLEVKLGDVLMTCAGPRVRCGVACLVERAQSKLMMSGKMYRFRPHPEAMHSKFLSFMLQTAEIQREIDQMKTGINDSGLNLTHSRFAALEVAVAPLNEQRRIVTKIEELFSKLDKGVESLKTAHTQLNIYRQAVLKHAFEGKLTAQWREENKDKLETPEQLLDCIKQEREARYERQLQEWKVDEKKHKKPKPPKYLPLLTVEELAELPELPEGWSWTRFGLLDIELKRGPFGSSITKSMFVPSGFKVYEQGNAIYREVSRGSYFINDEKYEELSAFAVLPGDFIVSCAGTVGRLFEIPDNAMAGVINQALMRIRINNTILSKRFFATLFESAFFQRKVLSDAKGTAMVNLAGIKELNLVPVAICSMSEQKVIEELLDTRLSEVDQCERIIATSLQQSEALRQSILKRAFSGQLVAQDPHEEPASVLMDRIKAEREKAAKNNHSKKTKKRKTTA